MSKQPKYLYCKGILTDNTGRILLRWPLLHCAGFRTEEETFCFEALHDRTELPLIEWAATIPDELRQLVSDLPLQGRPLWVLKMAAYTYEPTIQLLRINPALAVYLSIRQDEWDMLAAAKDLTSLEHFEALQDIPAERCTGYAIRKAIEGR